MSWKKVQKNLKLFNMDDEASDIINTTNDSLKEKQKEQWKEGKDKNARVIARYRSRKYAAAKFGMNPKAGLGNWDLTLTGKLAEKVRFSAVSKKVWARSDDSKYDKLAAKVPEAFGLNRGKINEYQGDTLLPGLQDSFRKKVLS